VRAPVITLATAVSEDAHRFEGAYASGVSIFGVAQIAIEWMSRAMTEGT
jgi:hypothetical protein